MKIISKFKDYYDYVADMYGGGDPKCTYERKGIRLEDGVFLPNSNDYNDKVIFHKSNSFENVKLRWLCVCGKQYLLVGTFLDFGNIISEKQHPELWSDLFCNKNLFRNYEVERCIGYSSEHIVQISKQICQPVFVIDGVLYDRKRRQYSYSIAKNTPILKDTGIASILPAEQCYQEIAYFISNVLPERSDITPPVEVDDRNKIIQAGFDLRTSFRHRK